MRPAQALAFLERARSFARTSRMTRARSATLSLDTLAPDALFLLPCPHSLGMQCAPALAWAFPATVVSCRSRSKHAIPFRMAHHAFQTLGV